MDRRIAIRVFYPLEKGRMVLRAEPDWEKDITPNAVANGESRFEFDLEVGSHRYFKPVIRDGDVLHWARGDNVLAVRPPERVTDGKQRPLEVYPYYFSEPKCSVCELKKVETKETGGSPQFFRVFYPPGYDENPFERYPVLYMQDAQNLFSPEEAFGGHDWKIEETLRILDSMNLIRKIIVVGVYPQNRLADYTSDGYERYGKVLVQDVKPWVDGNYRTKTSPRNTAVMGSSLGGVVSLYLGWQHPDVFGNVGCLSSTFGYRDDLASRIDVEDKREIRVYLDSGWPNDNYEATRSMRATLLGAGYEYGKDLFYLAFPNARHDEKDWAMRVHVPFQFFFDR
jgi:predicted alpha/beta superfamily hydrolase